MSAFWRGEKRQATAQPEASATLDYRWITVILERRRANYSTIVCVESQDQFRFPQLVAGVSASADYVEAPLYCYDRWNGLQRFDREAAHFRPVSRQAAGDYDPSVQNRIGELRPALREMERIGKSERAVLLLRDLDGGREEERSADLIGAFRAWHQDPEFLHAGTLVLLWTPSMSRVLDGATANLVALVRPPLGGAAERERIILDMGEKLGLRPDGREPLVVASAGFNLHQLRCALLQAYHATGGFDLASVRDLKTELLRRTEVLAIEEPDPHGFGAIGGYQAVKAFVNGTIIRYLREPGRAQRLALSLPRGVLLYGPPGTGKTVFAKALAGETGLPFIHLRTENLYSKWLGESASRFREAIEISEQMAPAIVFIDEVDRFGRRQGSPGDSAGEETRRVFSQVLEWLGDGNRRSVIVATTNRPQDLDPAFMRAGRLDFKIPFLYPGAEARAQILAVHLGLTGARPRPALTMSEAECDRVLSEIAAETDQLSGAELEQLVVRAKQRAFLRGGEGMEAADFRDAVRSYRIDREERRREREHYLQLAARFTDDEAFLAELRREA